MIKKEVSNSRVEQNTFLNCISLEELQMVRKKLSEKEKLW